MLTLNFCFQSWYKLASGAKENLAVCPKENEGMLIYLLIYYSKGDVYEA